MPQCCSRWPPMTPRQAIGRARPARPTQSLTTARRCKLVAHIVAGGQHKIPALTRGSAKPIIAVALGAGIYPGCRLTSTPGFSIQLVERPASMNHNDVRKAADAAVIPDKHYKLVRLLLDKARYGDAVIPDDKWAPSTRTLARRLHVVERSAQRYLLDLEDNGWFTRGEASRRGKVVGRLSCGQDFGFSTEGLCPVDGRPLPSPRAAYCSDRCRKAAQRDRKRDKSQVDGPIAAQNPATRTVTPPGDTKPDCVTFHVGTCRQVAVTNPRSARELTEEPRQRGEVVGQAATQDQRAICDHRYKGPPPHFCTRCGQPAGPVAVPQSGPPPPPTELSGDVRCPLCNEEHEGCRFAAGSAYCVSTDSAIPTIGPRLPGRQAPSARR